MTLRQEIERLKNEIKSVMENETPAHIFKVGYNTLLSDLVEDPTDILSRHPEVPTVPSQRDQIATACMQALLSRQNAVTFKDTAGAAITAADALIAELSKH